MIPFNEKFKITEKTEHYNINLDGDTKKFVDPFVIYLCQDEFSIKCSNNIADYFRELLQSVRNNNISRGEYLTKYLQENNEVRLGYSENEPRGKGLGAKKGKELLTNIRNSKAFQSGLIEDIFDASIMLDKVGFDRISDLTVNIILKNLIEFTQHQCKKYNVPMKEQKLKRPVWNSDNKSWEFKNSYLLPFDDDDKPIILVPYLYVQRRPVYTYHRFYDLEMMPYYEKIALNNPSYGLVRILKRGTVPAKTKIRKKYPCLKNEVVDYIILHSNEYFEYKNRQITYTKLNRV